VNFRRAREAAGLRVIDTANLLGVSTAAVCQWESGETFPSVKRLAKIAEIYKTTVDELLKEDANASAD